MFKMKKGQATVEFALLLPIMIFLILFIVELGMMLNSYLKIANASREAARLIAVGRSEVDAQTAIYTMTSGLKSSDLVKSITPAVPKKGDEVTVIITYKYTPLTGIFSAVWPNELSTKTVMLRETN